MTNLKTFLQEWCAKNNLEPEFIINQADLKLGTRVICGIYMAGIDYESTGSSTNVEDALEIASKRFLQHLNFKGLISVDSLPSNVLSDVSTIDVPQNESKKLMINVPQDQTPNMPDKEYRPNEETNYKFKDFLNDESKVEEADDLDVNTAEYGNCTIENAKFLLNQFIQTNKLKNMDYKYTLSEKGYAAESSLYVAKLEKSIIACGRGSNKRLASRKCALSLMRQLYHLGVIESFSGSMKKKKLIAVKSYVVNVDPLLLDKVHDILQELKIDPVIKNDTIINSETSFSLISNQVLAEFDESQPISSTGVIPWLPPQRNWNPWSTIKIDESHLATATLDQLSEELSADYYSMLNSSEDLKKKIVMRNELPVFAKKDEILDVVRKNSIVIIQGSSGCGKTTQVCQLILDDYLMNKQGAHCSIICTQPRCISAISMAERVAFERNEEIGHSVGYSVRVNSIFPRPYGSILFCSIGVLLRKLENLRGISHIIVDEIHKRDIKSDFLMVVLKDMIYNYPDLRVIFMSATINTDMFSNFFNCCPVIDIKGRCYSVKELFLEDIVQILNYVPTPSNKCTYRYKENKSVNGGQDNEENYNFFIPDSLPPEIKDKFALMNEEEIEFDIIEALLHHIETDMKMPGAVLIFLPSVALIFILRKYLLQIPFFASSKFSILPLYSKLSRANKRKVFEPVPPGVRKVILSTSIAETSITIDDVVFVINYGKTNLKVFTKHNNVTKCNDIWSSKADTQQRIGRAGRVKPGYCFHLFTKARYMKMDDQITPEIFRLPLHEIALFIKLLRLGNIEQFFSKAIEPPPIDAIVEAQVMLKEINCLGKNDELTPLGRILAKLPLEPQVGRMMLLGNILMLGHPLAVIAASFSNMTETFVYDYGTSPAYPFSGNRCSDHLSVLNAFQQWENLFCCNIDTTTYCKRKSLSLQSLTETTDIVEQLKDVFTKIGFPEICFEKHTFDFGKNNGHDELMLDMISGILVMGFYPNVCYYKGKRKVYTTQGEVSVIHKTSINWNYMIGFQSPFFVYEEKVRSGILACKQMTMVTPIHLLLFGARKIEYTNNVVQLDNRINLKMDAKAASAIVALRPAIESLIVRVSEKPKLILTLSEIDIKLINVLKELCNFNSGRYNLSPISFEPSSRYKRTHENTFCESDDYPSPKFRFQEHNSVSSNNHFSPVNSLRREEYKQGRGHIGNHSSLEVNTECNCRIGQK